MKRVFITCLSLFWVVSSMAQDYNDGFSHRMKQELPMFCGRVVGPEGQGVSYALVTLKYGKDSVRTVCGFLGEFLGKVSEIPDTLEIRVEAEGFKTSEWKYAAKEKGDNYLELRMSPRAKVLNEVTFSADKIQLRLRGKTFEYPNEKFKDLRHGFEDQFFVEVPRGGTHKKIELPDGLFVSRPLIKNQIIHYVNINKEGWDADELAYEKIMVQEALARKKYKLGFGVVGRKDLKSEVKQRGYVGYVMDYLRRGVLPYACVCLIDGKDTVRLTCDALGRFFWKTSKIPSVLTMQVMAEGYDSGSRSFSIMEERECIFVIGLAPKTIKNGLNHVIILDDKIQVKLGSETLEYPIGPFETLKGDFVGNLLRRLPGFDVGNGLLTVNGKPIHYIFVDKEKISTDKYPSIIENHIVGIKQIEEL